MYLSLWYVIFLGTQEIKNETCTFMHGSDSHSTEIGRWGRMSCYSDKVKGLTKTFAPICEKDNGMYLQELSLKNYLILNINILIWGKYHFAILLFNM